MLRQAGISSTYRRGSWQVWQVMPPERACIQLDGLEEEAEVLAAAAANVAKVVGTAHLGPASDRWSGPG